MGTGKKRTVKSIKRKPSRRRKKKSAVSAFLSSAKYLFIWAMMAAFLAICMLVAYDYFFPREKKGSSQIRKEQQDHVVPKAEKKKPAVANIPATDNKPTTEHRPATDNKQTNKQPAVRLTFPADTEIPRLQAKRKEQVICYTGHTVSYNVDYKLSNWVAWELTAQEAKSKENERSNKFIPDPTLKGQTALNEDYSRTGYDKGHMLPAGDVKWSAKAMRESFYYSNICPQIPGLNRGLWKDLEEQCRLWVKESGTLMIITGPVLDDNLKRLGKNRVAIPRRFYKVIATISNNTYEGIAFIMENKDYGRTTLKEVALPIDSVEAITGIDFFPTLPDQQENEMEAKINWSCWSF